jgi:hypothetical protein
MNRGLFAEIQGVTAENKKKIARQINVIGR